MSSVEAFERALLPHAAGLIGLARESIGHGFSKGGPLAVTASDFDPALRGNAASFVTLHCRDALRGCVGSIEPRVALVEDVARNAFLSAFDDSRFEPLCLTEFESLDIEISVLGPPAPIEFGCEAELLERLAPGRDGLIIEQDGRRALFLPQVWEHLPAPAAFLMHLKAKAGLGEAPLGRGARALRFGVVKLALSA